jgi:uncharacterized protein with GYD domain
MAKYLAKVNYSAEGLKGLLQSGGTARVDVVSKLMESVGGKVESFYFAFGDYDAFVILDVPDAVAGASVSLTVGASGAASVQVVQLLTPAEIDEAAKKSPAYTPPGR